jgi:hypothetical protein
LGAAGHRGVEREEREKLHFALKIHEKTREKIKKRRELVILNDLCNKIT